MKTIISLLFFISCSFNTETVITEETNVQYIFSETEFEIYDSINNHRQTLGLNTLQLNEYLSNKCLQHNTTMLSLNVLTHSGFDTRSEEIKFNFPTTKVGECISKGYRNPLAAWLNSPPHKVMLETEDYNHIGVSYLEGYCTIIMVK